MGSLIRKRKTKCLGVVPYPCRTCENVGAVCEYPPPPEMITVGRREWLDLVARAQAAESARSSAASPSSPPETENLVNHDDDWWFNRETLVVSKSGEHRVLGAGSSTYIATQLSPTGGSNAVFDMSPLHHTDLHLRRELDPDLPQLPPFDTAKRWYTAQFAYIGSIFSFIQPKFFDDRLAEVYSRVPDLTNREDCLLYCQIYLLMAFGQLYSLNQWASNEGPPGFVYFQAALKLLPDIHEEGSILFVEVLGLLSYFLQILNRRDAAFLYIGLAVRMAISLGMHQEITNSEMNDLEREMRRRTWWSTYSMDRILCVKSGNPISIHDEDIDAAWPSPLPELDLDPAPAIILAHYTQLSRILGKIGQDIYRKRHNSGTTLLASVQTIMGDLETWLRAIPPELKLDFTSIHHRISREAVSTFLHYYQCVNMTGRPILYRVCKRRLEALAAGTAPATWQEGLSSSVVHVVSNSIAAARAATTVMEAASKHNLLATYGFMDGEHAFSAALVLVMANVAFPYNDRDTQSMEQALAVLKGMAHRGNEYIRARHALLLNLRINLTRDATSRSISVTQNISSVFDNMNDGTDMDAKNIGQNDQPPLPVLPQFQGFPFDISMEDTDAFLNDFTGDAQFGMNSEMIESSFQYDSAAGFNAGSSI